MNKAEKNQEIESLTKIVSESQAMYVLSYSGLTVKEITELRRGLRKAGAKSKVTKNRLLGRSIDSVLNVAKAEELAKLKDLLTGTNFVVFSNKDAVSPAKVVAKFAATNDKLKVKGGWFEGAFVSPAGVEEISKMPSREELFAKLLALINAPATQLLRLFKAPAEQTVRLVEACRQKLESSK